MVSGPEAGTLTRIHIFGASGSGTSTTEGFTLVLAGLKALLEHGMRLNLVADRFPKGMETHS